jgi:hypothetical protein
MMVPFGKSVAEPTSDAIQARRTMARPNLQLQFAHSSVLRYGLAVASFATALGLALLAQRYGFHNVEVSPFLFSVAITAWYAGPRPAALAVVLSPSVWAI